MSKILKSNSNNYMSRLELRSDGNFYFAFNNKDRILDGHGTYTCVEDGIIINFLLFTGTNMFNGNKYPENFIPYTSRKFIKNSADLGITSYTLEGYFNPEDVVLVLYENL